MTTFVIVGGGLAGAKAAQTLRSEGFDGEIVLFSDERERPYERPALAKGYLQGKDERESVFVHPADWYGQHQVDLRLDTPATAIHTAIRTVAFAGGAIAYDKLAITTGAAARKIAVPGADLSGVFYLRTLGESEALRAAFTPGARVVIVGAGWIGLEAAAAARLAGSSVTVIGREPGPLQAALGPELGEKFAELHRSHGVTFRFGESPAEFRPAPVQGRPPAPGDSHEGWPVGLVVTSSGAELPADVVVVGVGAVPNDALAVAAGLEVGNGVVTDAALRTCDPDVFAAGDVANSYLPLLGRHLRLDHWSNALNGGKAVARSMLGQEVEYNRVPYFYSDQYDLGMECSGLPLPGGYDQIVYRGDSSAFEFIAFWLSQGRLIAGMNVNVWDVADDIQSLIRSAKPLDPTRLANPEIPLLDV
jgi:3-phenylpropionate/trans-cinnamate dioxygenase ferredoxin reductase subunit